MLRRLISYVAPALIAGASLAGAASSSVGIVGGSRIPVQSAPWSAFVAFEPGPGPVQYSCSGSVIDSTHVLTAAHCLYDDSGTVAKAAQLSVTAGVSNVAEPASSNAEQDRHVRSFRIHPGYRWSRDAVDDDIAVLRLSSPLQLVGAAVRAVSLPAPGAAYPAGAAARIAGFGLESGSQTQPTGALKSIAAVIDQQGQCGAFTRSIAIGLDNAVSFCPYMPAGSACEGDSGAGVVTTGRSPVLVGVIDGAPPGCRRGGASISTYAGAPEILRFIRGDDHPPTAPRPSIRSTNARLTWAAPLGAGDTLNCTTGGWSGPVKIVYSFVNKATGEVLQVGSQGSYLLPPSSVGTTVVCDVALSNAGGKTLVRTIATSRIKPAPQLAIVHLPTLTGMPGRTLTVDIVLRSPPGLSGKFGACVTLPAAVGGRLCRSTHEPWGASGSFPFALTLQIKPTAPAGRRRIAITASAGLSTTKSTALLQIARS